MARPLLGIRFSAVSQLGNTARLHFGGPNTENYLTPPPGSDHRDPNKFWVTQAVLKYTNMTLPDGDHSQNFTGAGYLNPVFS